MSSLTHGAPSQCPTSLWVKVCGVTQVENALECARAGVSAVGLNFWPSSKRFVTDAQAVAVASALPREVQRVGLFVNAPLQRITACVERVGLDRVQLSGDEPPALLDELVARLGGHRVIRTVRLAGPASLAQLEAIPASVWVLLDANVSTYGGSGVVVDPELARAAALQRPVVLAGGLTPENVAPRLTQLLAPEPGGGSRPTLLGVDVASGVESAPGVKAPERVRPFVFAARQAALAYCSRRA
jgi:phosphoribosylanthranilate isomerase